MSSFLDLCLQSNRSDGQEMPLGSHRPVVDSQRMCARPARTSKVPTFRQSMTPREPLTIVVTT